MSEKKHFNPDDDISPEDIQRYFEHKGIPDVICPLCRKDAFILTDSMPFEFFSWGNSSNATRETKYRQY